MRFFLDTAITSEVEEFIGFGVVDGITTNPTLIAKGGRDHHEVIKELTDLIEGPVSAEVLATTTKSMIDEGFTLATIADNVVVKLPCTRPGFLACKELSGQKINVNMTLCFSVSQAMIACKAGASYVSPFIGRLEDAAEDGFKVLADIIDAIANSEFYVDTIAASIRSQEHVEKCAVLGSNIATIPVPIMHKLFDHELTDSGLAKFLEDAKGTPDRS